MFFISKNPKIFGLAMLCAGAILTQESDAKSILSAETAWQYSQNYAPFLAQQSAQNQLAVQNIAFAQQSTPPQLLVQREDQGANLPSVVLGISQNLNGKQRGFAVQTAQLRQNLTQNQLAQSQLQREAETMHAYLTWQIAEANQQLQQNIENIAQKTYETAQIRLQAGAISPVEAARAELNFNQTHAQTQAGAQAVCQAALALGAYWGETVDVCTKQQPTPLFTQLPEKLAMAATPEASTMARHIELTAQINHATQNQNLAERQGVPNIFLNLKRPDRRHGQIGDSDSFTVGFTMPLVFGKRVDATQAAFAQANQQQQTADQNWLNQAWQSRAAQLRTEFVAAKQQLLLIDSQQLPLAESIVARSQLGYAAGKFDLNSVLAAQNELLLLQKQKITQLAVAWRAVYAARYLAAGW